MLTTIETPKEEKEPCTLIEVKVVKQQRSMIEYIGPVVVQSFWKLSFVKKRVLNLLSVNELILCYL